LRSLEDQIYNSVIILSHFQWKAEAVLFCLVGQLLIKKRLKSRSYAQYNTYDITRQLDFNNKKMFAYGAHYINFMILSILTCNKLFSSKYGTQLKALWKFHSYAGKLRGCWCHFSVEGAMVLGGATKRSSKTGREIGLPDYSQTVLRYFYCYLK